MSINPYKPIPFPTIWQRNAWTKVDLDDPKALLSYLVSSDSNAANRESVFYHATPAQLAAVTTFLHERERERAQNTANALLMAAAEAQGHAR
jgi:hypothetical protein